ncbi:MULTISPECIES: deoxynucleoside kinase [unclassified Neorhizobium]|uniref:deoxynucleoside kinase n=1 Tax=unclassified Neorhizobium TaxID=2629175 RepID=UPI001FF2F8B3|nr:MULTISPECIES: deoxynucleoside kinase [unclassified Neorhizobium]MCJ9669450.1 ATP-binding protein [Neorhizobium sp. SHOUNA12B]MCJ9745525.1 ATP-binding protein [Neorhizobium sp. SHOUNA12A]
MRSTDDLEDEVKNEYAGRLVEESTQGTYGLVLGGTSSGKSTAITSLIERHPGLTRAYDGALLQLPRFQRYFERLFKAGDSRAYLPFEIEALLIRHLQNEKLGEATIADQGIHSIWAYARAVREGGEMDDDSYQTMFALYLFLRRQMHLPKFVLHFRCDTAVARKRLELRGRAHEKSYSRDFLDRLDQAYSVVCRDFPADISVMTIDTTHATPTEVADRLEKIALSQL